ncbi:MAG: NAD-dependent epimerase/dehydratase family protein [Clostridium sp.]|nr:NAD-dependent epimerase/dehydratase family protein [Clostridium sp.]
MNENTIYLVTGAAGFLGSCVCRRLAERGCRVRGLVLPDDPAAKYLPEEVQKYEVDYFDETKVLGCYSMSKALASQEVLDACHHRGLNACIVHPSGIMGPGDYAAGEITQNLVNIINGELPAGIDGNFNLCDVRDLADGIIAAAEKGRSGECYILANEPVTFRDFCRMVTEESGGKKVIVFLPIFAADMMARMMEAGAKKTGEKPVMTTFSVYNLARNNVFDSGKAKEELGYKTRSYEETIHDQIQWLLAEGLSDILPPLLC